MKMRSQAGLAAALFVALLAAWPGPAVWRFAKVVGIFRRPSSTPVDDRDFHVIEDTTHCEDIHYHAPRNSLFAACQDIASVRFRWFPPVANFDDPVLASTTQGSIHVIDAETTKSRRLVFENFELPFITHGIDVIADPVRPLDAVYIFAVNHLPDPGYLQVMAQKENFASHQPKARSQVEVFHHVLGSPSIRHVRSVRHPVIRTPNDILAVSPTSFLVTNDHHYREGLMRRIESTYFGAAWTDTVHVSLAPEPSPEDPTVGVNISVALSSVHYNNGIGHGRSRNEVLVVSTVSSRLHLGRIVEDDSNHTSIQLEDVAQVDSIIDNPSFFEDPFATATRDYSGYVLPGLSHAIGLATTIRDPEATNGVAVWFVRPAEGGWEKRILFEDDGSRIRSASGAVLVALPPDEGPRRARLFITGFFSANVVMVELTL